MVQVASTCKNSQVLVSTFKRDAQVREIDGLSCLWWLYFMDAHQSLLSKQTEKDVLKS